ncbi:MAG: transglycosylase SLT domain-containing protein [Bacteroidota bacterium]
MKSLIFCLFFAPIYSQLPAPFSNENWDHEMVEVNSESKSGVLMSLDPIYTDKWSDLNQPLFWKQIMRLHPDSCMFNVASNRQVLTKYSSKKWNKKTPAQQKLFKDSLRTAYGIAATERLNCTTGKSDFYRFDDVYKSLTKGILAFERFQVDPWYAQAILLIESPGQLVKSNVGAYGAFQLMPGVARSQGLKVNKTVDERKNFDRSAYAAASLIRKSCIPLAKSILDSKKITYNESDLWFRLFVMHVYHAGAGNVKAVFNKINPTVGGQELITKMWQTEAGSFGNSSQNYTQLVIASQMILQDMVGKDCSKMFECTGE